MSRTTKTSKARVARKMYRSFLGMMNGNHSDRYAQCQQELNAIGVNGKREGNERKAKARGKVVDRRIERRKANRAAKNDSDFS